MPQRYLLHAFFWNRRCITTTDWTLYMTCSHGCSPLLLGKGLPLAKASGVHSRKFSSKTSGRCVALCVAGCIRRTCSCVVCYSNRILSRRILSPSADHAHVCVCVCVTLSLCFPTAPSAGQRISTPIQPDPKEVISLTSPARAVLNCLPNASMQ